MRRCHGNRGVLFQKCQIVLLSSHFSDNLVSLSPAPSLTPPSPGFYSSSLSLSPYPPFSPTPDTQALPRHPQPCSNPRRKWSDQFHPQPLTRPEAPSCVSGPGASPLWERCLPLPPLVFGRLASPSRGLLECSGVILFC